MEAKIDAIEKYLKKNLDTDEQVMDFFEKYMSKVTINDVDQKGRISVVG